MGNDLNANDDDPHYAQGPGQRHSAEECQQLCQEVQECNFFTYTAISKNCWLKTSSSGRRKHTQTTSGPKTCKKGYYITIFQTTHIFKPLFYYYEGLYASIAPIIQRQRRKAGKQ